MAAGTQTEKVAAAWLARMDREDWSTATQAELEAWLDAATANRVAYLRLRAAWDESGRLAALGAGRQAPEPPPRGHWRAAFGTARDAVAARAPEHEEARTRRAAWVFGAASVALAVSLLSGLAWFRFEKPVESTYRTAMGDLRAIPLADGSRITLSSDSTVRVSLGRDERHVVLDRGEAFFEVAKDRSRPFVIEAGERRVRVVGTRFAVRRGGEAGAGLRVVVTQGLVQLESGPGADGRARASTLLPPGSVALASGAGLVVRSGTVADAERALDWRNGFLDFNDTTLAEAVDEFNRYNRRKLVIGDPDAGALRVGGHFRWSNVDAFVRLLELGFPVRAETRGDAVVLHSSNG
jgi:transmembrane sensor